MKNKQQIIKFDASCDFRQIMCDYLENVCAKVAKFEN